MPDSLHEDIASNHMRARYTAGTAEHTTREIPGFRGLWGCVIGSEWYLSINSTYFTKQYR